ncbi:hypothetical protein BC938DRAFT_470974 [Jimgerdemannia flammicorona]|uniref:Uncharacterized protein n=1 Tax=Jimgerdemannia flammicorona TaxID=994334 RepID=A0A433QUW7_9FUNG|nr:hypothetical protein BC938DRAFT_470974 [Jimgerdemannia flammicorona]
MTMIPHNTALDAGVRVGKPLEPLRSSIQFVYHEILNDYDTIWCRVLSKGYISMLPEDKTEELCKSIFAVLEDPEDDIQIDPTTGLMRFPYETEVVWVKRRD